MNFFFRTEEGKEISVIPISQILHCKFVGAIGINGDKEEYLIYSRRLMIKDELGDRIAMTGEVDRFIRTAKTLARES